VNISLNCKLSVEKLNIKAENRKINFISSSLVKVFVGVSILLPWLKKPTKGEEEP
jgi:hypothetical protein